jgi:hypothetical protein
MSENKSFVQGSGGGGGKAGASGVSQATTADDTLASKQFARVLDLLSEGEIQGIEEIRLNNVPLQQFKGYEQYTRLGTQDQDQIPGFPSTESTTGVNVPLTKNSPQTITISDQDVDRVRLTLTIPSLQKIEKDGDIVGHKARVGIEVQYNGGGFVEVVDDKIVGKTSSKYQKDYIIVLTGAFPVDIKFSRLSDDDGGESKKSSTTIFQSFTQIIDEKLRYPNSALSALRINSRQFSSIPSRKYLIRGIKVKIPSNAGLDVTNYIGRLTYTGVWDGTFQAATWTNDPAWILYDLLTSERYGAGIPETQLEKFDFYAISQYCNELVPDGIGSETKEPRFSCNILINSRDEVYNVIQQMTAIFRGIAYYGVGTLQLLQDKPADPQYLIGPSNVVEGLFEYQGTSQKTRHSVVSVAWQAYDTFGDVEYEYVEDPDAVAKYGIVRKDIKAIGCYSQGQAHRIGKWTLLSEQALSEVCNFSVAIESGIILRPGMVVDIADPIKSANRRSGRIKSATTTQITTDSSADLTAALAANNPLLSVLLSTGHVEQRTVSSIAIVGDTAQINVATAFSEAPPAGSVFLFQNDDVQSQRFRVLSVAEAGDGIYGVSAVAYNGSIYDAVDKDLDLTFRKITTLTDPPNPPGDLTGTEYLYEEGLTIHTGFDLSWSHDGENLDHFEVRYRLNDDNFTEVETEVPNLTILALKTGVLEVEVRAASFINVLSDPATAVFDIAGKTAPPGDVQNLSIEVLTDKLARLKWDQTVDLDVKVNGFVHIRHAGELDGTGTWPDAIDLVPAVPGNSTEAIVPLLEGEILVKFEDDLGNKSVNATSVLVDFPDALGPLLVKAQREDAESPPFNGTFTDCFYDLELDALTIDLAIKFDSLAPDGNFDGITQLIDSIGETSPSATYQFENALDLGSTFALDLKRRFVTRGYFPDAFIDSRVGLIDTWTDFDGGEPDAVNAKIYLRSTNDDPASGTATFSDWKEFVNGTFKGRGFQFKTVLTTADPAQNILVDVLGYIATFQLRIENAGPIDSGTSTNTVTFNNPFFTGASGTIGGENKYPPSVGVMVNNLGAGEVVKISNVTSTTFDIDILASDGSNVDREFHYSAAGYGKGGL